MKYRKYLFQNYEQINKWKSKRRQRDVQIERDTNLEGDGGAGKNLSIKILYRSKSFLFGVVPYKTNTFALTITETSIIINNYMIIDRYERPSVEV